MRLLEFKDGHGKALYVNPFLITYVQDNFKRKGNCFLGFSGAWIEVVGKAKDIREKLEKLK